MYLEGPVVCGVRPVGDYLRDKRYSPSFRQTVKTTVLGFGIATETSEDVR